MLDMPVMYDTKAEVWNGSRHKCSEGQRVVPKGSLHSYSIPEAFTAVEVTSPPAQAHGRDERQMRDQAQPPKCGPR